MKDLLLHPTTRYHLEALLQSPPQGLLIVGQAGSGKQTVAETYISNILGVQSLSQHPYFLNIASSGNSIGIDDIRQIRGFLNKKTTGTSPLRRAILIINAHDMTVEAQNALLKTLEEPPADTVVVLTTNDLTGLKPTIRSRLQSLHLMPSDQASALHYFEHKGLSGDAIQKAFFMSGGRVGLLSALLDNTLDHNLAKAINDAKEIIHMKAYERLLLVDSLSKQKEQTLQLLMGLERVAISGMRQAADKHNENLTRSFYTLSACVVAAKNMLDKNVNTKSVLSHLFMVM